MSAFVVDSNVPIVANGKSEQADEDCMLACINALEEIRNSGVIVLDDMMRILDEYMQNLNMSGQPGVGDLFMKWVWSVQAVSDRCEQVTLTQRGQDEQDFEEFPNDPALADFDPSDRKFVAVALASEQHPAILNAVDSDWANHHKALTQQGVVVRFLCPQHVCPTE